MSDARILIAHKSLGVRQSLRHAFESEGFSCEEADHGWLALSMIEAGSHEVAVLGASLPFLNGWHVLERGRNVRPNLGVVILGGPPISIQDWRIAVVDNTRVWPEVIPETLEMFARRALRRAA